MPSESMSRRSPSSCSRPFEEDAAIFETSIRNATPQAAPEPGEPTPLPPTIDQMWSGPTNTRTGCEGRTSRTSPPHVAIEFRPSITLVIPPCHVSEPLRPCVPCGGECKPKPYHGAILIAAIATLSTTFSKLRRGGCTQVFVGNLPQMTVACQTTRLSDRVARTSYSSTNHFLKLARTGTSAILALAWSTWIGSPPTSCHSAGHPRHRCHNY